MKHIIAVILCAISLSGSAAMLDIDGQIRTEPYTIAELTRQCDFKGYFLYGGTIYQCVKIREGVTKAELRAHAVAEKQRVQQRIKEIKQMRRKAINSTNED